ncbi:hypothetical protein ACQJ9L_05635 [Helicobacter pylori]
MRQKHETAKSFNELKSITQAIMLKKRIQTSENANISDLTQKTGLKPKAMLQTKKGTLNPTKKAFSERQKATNAPTNALKTPKNEQANNSNLKAEPSNKAFKQSLTSTQEKGGSNEA